MAKEIKSMTEFEEILSNEEYVVVDFYARWCPPCKLFAITFSEASEIRKDIPFLKVEVDDNLDIHDKYLKEGGVPQMMLYKNGVEVKRVSGFVPTEDIIKFIEV